MNEPNQPETPKSSEDKPQDTKNSTKPAVAEDFDTSMARLAQLAEKTLAPKNPPKEDSDLGTRKKKKKRKLRWYEKALGSGSISIRMSYLAASGIALLIGGMGVAVLPKVFEIMETQRDMEFAMKAPAIVHHEKVSKKKKKVYSLVDAVSDTAGTKGLSEKSFTELVTDVSATEVVASFSETAKQLMGGLPGSHDNYLVANSNGMGDSRSVVAVIADHSKEDWTIDNSEILGESDSTIDNKLIVATLNWLLTPEENRSDPLYCDTLNNR